MGFGPKTSFAPKGYSPRFLAARMMDSPEENTGALTLLAGRAYARYIGRYAESIRSVDLHAFVNGVAAAGAGYCELAVATSVASDLYAASVDLTMRGFASIDTAVKAGATVNTRVQLTGLSLPVGADLWAVVACSYATTQASFRTAGGGGGSIYGHARQAAGPFQPSASLGIPTAFTWTVGVASIVPMMAGEPR